MNRRRLSWTTRLFNIKNRNILVDLLSAAYGLGSWIAMTGLWVELPLLVQRLPEGWTLASRLTLVLQIANIGPIAYGFLNKYFPDYVTERSGTHAQLATGSLSTLLLIFFWSHPADIAGSSHSIPLYILSFGLSVVDCTSSVVFLPYMAFFKSIYLVPYLIGEGFSGFLPSLVAMAQGIDEEQCFNQSIVVLSEDGLTNVTRYEMMSRTGDPRFEPEWFFTFLLSMVLLSWGAFVLLDNLKLCKKEMVSSSAAKEFGDWTDALELKEKKLECIEREAKNFSPRDNDGRRLCVHFRANNGSSREFPLFSKKTYFYLLFIQCWASVTTFGVFPAVQPYSCLPYSNEAFHYTVTLCGLAYPVACLAAMVYEIRSLRGISSLTVIGTVTSVFIMYTAVTSPVPPFVGTTFGGYLVVICWVSFIFILSYVKTMATVLLGDYWGQRGLFWCGAVTQAGAAIGALLMFLLINVFELFQDNRMCH